MATWHYRDIGDYTKRLHGNYENKNTSHQYKNVKSPNEGIKQFLLVQKMIELLIKNYVLY